MQLFRRPAEIVHACDEVDCGKKAELEDLKIRQHKTAQAVHYFEIQRKLHELGIDKHKDRSMGKS